MTDTIPTIPTRGGFAGFAGLLVDGAALPLTLEDEVSGGRVVEDVQIAVGVVVLVRAC
jgi:hypothetical protein